jgi:hypothetical protein
MLARSWIGLIRTRRFGEGDVLWDWVADCWTEPENGGGVARWPCEGCMRVSIKALGNFFLRSPVSDREVGMGLRMVMGKERVNGKQRQ